MAQPTWYAQLRWTGPHTVSDLNINRKIIPSQPGCYVFTTSVGALLPRQVLYVGEAKVSLHKRLSTYLVALKTKPPGSKSHKGGGFVLEARANNGDHGVYVRWVEYFGSPWQVSMLEASLIDYLQPLCNDREESWRSGLLGDWESLDPDAL